MKFPNKSLMATNSEALAMAIRHHREGRLQAAEQIYRRILDVEPNHADAIHLLGLIALQVGKFDEAVAHCRRALELVPDCADLDLLAEEGGGGERVTFVAHQPRQRCLRYYHGIDIGLDTVPYNGHTTSLDSFWMGVPVVTLVGPTVVGRAGLCQLTNLGLPERIASSPADYVRIAAELAQDIPRLDNLRATLRQRMRSSPLTDAARFARNIKAAYREMWRRWCGKRGEAST
jgi:tetratricopeptide (TPR) repeat protein